MSEDDLLIVGTVVIGVVVIALIAFFGVRSTRKKNRSTTPAYSTKIQIAANQPVLITSSMGQYDGKRQWELFQQETGVGTELTVPDEAGGTRTLRVSRVTQEVREGYPQAKVGFLAYFEPYEFAEFPATYPMTAKLHRTLELTRDGVRVIGTDGSTAWEAQWSNCHVAAHAKEIRLAGPNGSCYLYHADLADHQVAEEILVKYGVYNPKLAL